MADIWVMETIVNGATEVVKTVNVYESQAAANDALRGMQVDHSDIYKWQPNNKWLKPPVAGMSPNGMMVVDNTNGVLKSDADPKPAKSSKKTTPDAEPETAPATPAPAAPQPE